MKKAKRDPITGFKFTKDGKGLEMDKSNLGFKLSKDYSIIVVNRGLDKNKTNFTYVITGEITLNKYDDPKYNDKPSIETVANKVIPALVNLLVTKIRRK